MAFAQNEKTQPFSIWDNTSFLERELKYRLGMIPELPGTHLVEFQPLHPDEIRLMTLQPGQKDDLIRFSLVHTTLVAARNTFTALSYTWGDSSNKQLFECNDAGERFLMTHNCERAIRRIRSTHSTVNLWIDAICINQEDLIERESQVEKMGSIYAAAAEVVVYLGEEEHDSKQAMDFLASLHTQSWQSVLSDDMKLALQSLLRRSWFSRIWVLQEIHNAKHVRMVCGEENAPWSNLLVYKWWHHLGRRDFDNWPLVMSVRDRSRYGPDDLLKLLLQARKSGATDPKDKVYAILPMIKEDRATLPQPNYTLSKEEAYLETAMYLLKSGLHFLCAISHKLGSLKQSNLPSWVPRWDEFAEDVMIWPDTGGAIAEDIQLDRNGEIIHNPYKINGSEFYCAGGELLKGQLPFSEVLRPLNRPLSLPQLKVNGTIVSPINALSGPMYMRNEDIWTPFAALWQAMRPESSHVRYKDGDATLRWAQHPLLQSIDSAMSHMMWHKPKHGVSYAHRHEQGVWAHSHRLRDMHARREASGLYQRWCEEFVGLIRGRRIMVTVDGCMGMAPIEAQIGDIVCIIHGAVVPFILRPVGSAFEKTYQLVGPCYLNWMMTSEGFDKLKCERRMIPDHKEMAFGRDFILV